MKRLFISLVLMASAVALAAGTSATVTWQPPTAYVDGSPLPAADIASYTVLWMGGQKTVTGLTTTVPVPCGSQSFTVTVTTTSTAKYPNTTSDPSGSVNYASGVTCRPNPPTSVTAS